MSIIKKVDGIRSIMVGAVLTGVSLVIANAWGDAIKKSVTKMVNKVRCSKFSLLKDQDKYQKCQKNDLVGLYINAIITTVVLSIIAFLIYGNGAAKKMNSK